MNQPTQNRVPVLDTNGQPLAPCTPRRARVLIRDGRATGRHRNGIFHITLQRAVPTEAIQQSKLMIDPGSKFTGISVVHDDADGNRTVQFCMTIRHRTGIKDNMTQRAQMRRTRRGKLRYRPPRFDNRKRPEDWLPPSLKSKLDNTLTWVNRTSGLIASSDIHVETTQFDAQRLRYPEIRGKDYQQGPLYQTTLRAYVIHRDNGRCQYCGKKPKRIELDHAVPVSAGGQDTPSNRLVSCEKCNRKKGSKTLAEFLKRRPKTLEKIKAQLQQPLDSAAHVNVIIPHIVENLSKAGWTVTEHDAAQTAANRKLLEVEKSHHADAAVLGEPATLQELPNRTLIITATGRGQRKRIMSNKNGTPRGEPWREYCRLTPAERKDVPAPGHKKRAKRVEGIGGNDLVRIERKGQVWKGHAEIYRNRVTLKGAKPTKTAYLRNVQLVARHHGYTIKTTYV